MLNFAIQVARDAGRVLLEKFDREIEINKKGDIDLVTEADIASEHLIVERIKSYYPRHSILAEESGETIASADAEWKWIIDPLDGTTNFAHGYPCFAVNIALEHRGEVVIGVTYDPTRNELFAAEKGGGASLNGRPIKVSPQKELKESLLVTGFPYNIAARPHLVDQLTNFLTHTRAIRRDGAAAIDMAYVAAGRFEGFWEEGLKPWDVAAGVLLITEAGGVFSGYNGQSTTIYEMPICCSNGHIHSQMIDILS